MKPTALATILLFAAAAAPALGQARPKPAAAPAEKPAECAAAGELPKTWEGQAFAIDGDTLGGTGLKAQLRIWGIRAPELRDPSRDESVAGMRARAILEDLLGKANHTVSCRAIKWDRECRIVAQCAVATTPTAIDLGGAMLASGMVYAVDLHEPPPWEARAGQRYATAEGRAREQKLGMWPTWLGEK